MSRHGHGRGAINLSPRTDADRARDADDILAYEGEISRRALAFRQTRVIFLELANARTFANASPAVAGQAGSHIPVRGFGWKVNRLTTGAIVLIRENIRDSGAPIEAVQGHGSGGVLIDDLFIEHTAQPGRIIEIHLF